MEQDPKRRGLKSLRAKILLFAGVPTLLLLVTVIAFLTKNSYDQLYTAFVSKINVESANIAEHLNNWNNEAVTVPRIMASAQEHGLFGKREDSIRYARDVLEMYPQFTGAYFGYETNSDGADANFAKLEDEQSKNARDPNGRFIPYWFRDKEDTKKIVLNPLID